MSTNSPTALDRRSFLSLSALTGGGFLLGFYAGISSSGGAELGQPTDTSLGEFSPNAFLRISPDGTVTIVAHKPDMGQGVTTSIPMILAEELDVDWQSVKLDIGRADSAFGNQLSGGSRSVPNSYDSMRQMGATARAMLVTAAAQIWGVPEAELTTAAGSVTHAASDRKAGYGELVAKAKTLPVPLASSVRLKDPKDFKLLGTRVGNYQNRDIVTGKPLFGIDQKVPGMLHAVYQKCPVFGGKVVSANLDTIKTLPGVKNAFIIAGTDNLVGLMPGVAIVADSTWSAISARRQLEVQWDEGDHANDSSVEFAKQAAELGAKPEGMSVVRNDGDTSAALATAAKVIEANYSYPLIAHACMEPMNTLAYVQGDRAELWSPCQEPAGAARAAAAATGIPVGNIKVNVARMGGAFGRRWFAGFAAEAAIISQKSGAPVKLTWTREDDMRHDEYRPGGFHHFKGGIDEAGKLIAWQNHYVTFGVMGRGRGGESLQAGIGAGLDGGQFPARFVPNFRTVQSLLDCRIPMGPWRCPGNNAFGFAIQGFIDELANAAGKDPLLFRLDLLNTPPLPNAGGGRGGGFGGGFSAERARGVLQLAAEKAGWGKRFERGQGAGIAFHFSHQGYVAYVAEVSVSKAGALKVDRVVAAVDVGRQIVNLSGAEGQIEGSIIDALSAAKYQEVVLERGRMVKGNFAEYPMLRINEAPTKIKVHFLRSDNSPTGLGEPGIPPLAPAVANAVFAAIGKRIREFPFSKTDLSWS
ncbi:molybdopterin cofactor-binding domain-containing protein [Haloferula sp. BvORR071]|uniref:xanthine dehydrogenase family protein molybdopterin-binding subunit n=1 Tax=Haloferula sp. BvORR071 TaxID=1396141 RepID=UPI0005506819|nr:molybdopterin cofactor-binding domain-containing protein [Haloferula sp. BvORR071]